MSAGYGVATVQRPRVTRLAEMRVRTSKSLRATADKLEERHPEMGTHKHLRDAARALDSGLNTAAGRHLDAAMHTLTPQSLIRHGIKDDQGHVMAKQDMNEVWRHSLAVKDLTDLHDETQQRLAEHRARKQGLATDQPPGVGPPDGSARGPSAASPEKILRPGIPAAKAAADSAGGSLVAMSNTLEFVGPKGYEHGWKFVGIPKFRYAGGQGGNGHILAIHNLGDKYKGTGEMAIPYAAGPANDILTTSMHHTADAVARRDFHAMDVHLSSALYAAKHVGPQAVSDVLAVRRSLEGLSPAVSGRHNARPGATKYGRSEMGRDLMARSYSETARNLGLQGRQMQFSAETARLAVTPAPRGKPGGPGLYHVKDLGHTAYLQQIVKALIGKRGMEPGKAYAIARAAIRKWSRGGGHVHPEVQAASGAAEAGELARQARAHSHSMTWEQADYLIELATGSKPQGGSQRPQSSNWKNEPRVPPGPGGGEFGSKGGQKEKGGKPPQAHGGSLAQRRAKLLATARADRARAHVLMAELHALTHGGKSASSKPRQTGAGATAAKQAQQASAQAKSGGAAKSGASPKTQSRAAKIAALRAEIRTLLTEARKAAAQARAL